MYAHDHYYCAHDHYYCAHAQTNDSATMYEFRHSYGYGYEHKMYYKLASYYRSVN